MAKLQPYQQQTLPSSKQATPQDFGFGVAQAMGQTGQQLTEMENRRQNRADTIERIRSEGNFALVADQEFQRMRDEEDLTDTQIVNRYSAFLNEQKGQILSNFQGGPAARDELAAKLEGARINFSRNMYKENVSAQYQLVDSEIKKTGKTYSDMAGNDPSTLPGIFAAIDDDMENWKNALPKGAEMQYRNSLRSQAVQSAVSTQLAREDYDAAEVLLSDPTVKESLNSDMYRQLKTQVIVGRRADEKEAARIEADIQKATTIAGIQAQSEIEVAMIKAELAKSNRKWSDLTPMEKSELWVRAREEKGMPVTQDQIDKIQGAYIADSQKGNSVAERQLSSMTEVSDALIAGTADQNQLEQFQNAYALYMRERVYRDEMGNTVRSTPMLPPHLQAAAEAAGLSTGQQPGFRPEDMAPGGVDTTQEQDDVPFNESLIGLNLAGQLTGPEASVPRWIRGIPVVGDISGVGAEKTAALQYFQGKTESLYRLFAENPKLPVKEIEWIRQAFDIEPKLMRSQGALNDRMISVMQLLKERRDRDMKDATQDRSPKVRNHAMAEVRAINDFLKYMGADKLVEVKTVDELKELQSKDQLQGIEGVILPDNRILPVPQGGFNFEGFEQARQQ